MNIVRKFAFLVVILGVTALFAGCQLGLSEEEVRSIVREEIASQLATGQIRGVVGQEVANQLASIDELEVSRLYILDPEGERVILLTSSGLLISEDGHTVASLGTINFGSGAIGGGLMLFNPNGKLIVSLMSTEDGNGLLNIYDKYGRFTFVAP